MKYYWTKEPYEGFSDLFCMSCFFTDLQGRRHDIITLVKADKIEEFKKDFEESHPAQNDGAWRPKEDAYWTISEGICRIREEQIELV